MRCCRPYLRNGAYTDCYATELPRRVSHAQYVEAFYTTPVFRLERWLLTAFVRKPSTDAEARQLAHGEIDAFAAWHVERRGANQLLLCDYAGSTRSWLMTAPDRADTATTRLYFGSAVVAQPRTRAGHARLGLVFSRTARVSPTLFEGSPGRCSTAIEPWARVSMQPSIDAQISPGSMWQRAFLRDAHRGPSIHHALRLVA